MKGALVIGSQTKRNFMAPIVMVIEGSARNLINIS